MLLSEPPCTMPVGYIECRNIDGKWVHESSIFIINCTPLLYHMIIISNPGAIKFMNNLGAQGGKL